MALGFTLPELVVALAVVGALAAITVPRAVTLVDRLAVDTARREAATAYAYARHVALLRGVFTTVTTDHAGGVLVVRAGVDTLHTLRLGERHRVTLTASRDSLAFAPNGFGWGAANLRVVLTRGSAAETIVVSRLGRVRY